MLHNHGSIRIFAILSLGLFLLLPGCTGHARSGFVSANMSDIAVEPTDARTIQLNCDECYWWIDQDNRLNIAGKGIIRSLLNKNYDQEYYISFVLDEPSRGVGKNFQINAHSVRGVIKSRGNIYRFQSTYGILGSENRNTDQIIAAYRTHLSLFGAKLFGGWSKAIPFVTFGTLRAVPDRDDKGKTIREKTEADGYERKFPKRVHTRRMIMPQATQPTVK